MPAPDVDKASPQDRLEAARAKSPAQKAQSVRILQGQSEFDAQKLAANDRAEASDALACWQRLDGIWQDDTVIALDPAPTLTATGWAADLPRLKALAHGTFTEPSLLVVAPSDDHSQKIEIADAFDPSRRAVYKSSDMRPIADVLRRGERGKIYIAEGESPFGDSLRVDVSSRGYVRMRLDRTLYQRPSPGLLQNMADNEVPINDVFIYSANLSNVQASRRGYDITKQDHFDILGSNKQQEVFKESFGTQYRILEKRTVPLGFDLIPDPMQGMVYQRRFNTTERDLQRAYSLAFGGKARIGLAPGGAEVGPSKSAGVDIALRTARSMRDRRTAARASGYSRSKRYAIVVDHPFIELSDAFVDAVNDAKTYGDEDIAYYDDIILKFGTHYPYAVTYGANGEVTTELTESESYERLDRSAKGRIEGEMELVKGSVSAYVEGAIEDGKGSGKSAGSERVTFQGVGGNGSWDQNGFMAGDEPAPILLDLRPLDQLLGPIHFPGETEIHTKVRDSLHARIRDYTELRAAGLSGFPIYDTRLDGSWYSEAFPDVVFEFTATDYVTTHLVLRHIDGRSWETWQADLADAGKLKTWAPLKESYEHFGHDIASQYRDRRKRGGRTPPTIYTRDEDSQYRHRFGNLSSTEIKRALETREVFKGQLDHATLNGKLGARAIFTALPDGTIVMKQPGNLDIEGPRTATFRRWTTDDAWPYANARRQGAWRSDLWPDVTLALVEDPSGGHTLLIMNNNGDLPVSNCLQADDLRPKSREEMARLSAVPLEATREGDETDPVRSLRLSGKVYKAGPTFEEIMSWSDLELSKSDLKADELVQVEAMRCLRDKTTLPYGSVPYTSTWQTDDRPATRALPVLEIDERGSAALRFYEFDPDVNAGMQNLDERFLALEPGVARAMDKTIALEPIDDEEAVRIHRSYLQAVRTF